MRYGRRVVGFALLASIGIGLSGCVAPARTYPDYEGKAADTADTVLSAVETARLAATAAGRDDAFAPYLSVVLGEAEGDASSARGLFDSIQPPDPRSDRLRERLDRIMDQAIHGLAVLRISVRRGEVARLLQLAGPLGSVSDELDAFSKAHS
jgi:alkanesulfonate monooxygenase SsuD/methylene tetrahydromethanopterin reductase-like flavin-dependent oxidoreductase (luciferase family)